VAITIQISENPKQRRAAILKTIRPNRHISAAAWPIVTKFEICHDVAHCPCE